MQDAILPGLTDHSTVDLLSRAGNRLEGKIRAIQGMNGEAKKSELRKATGEFEAVFISYMLKVMRETIDESGLMGGGLGKSIYTEMFDQEIARTLAQRGMLGISDLLYRNIEHAATEKEDGEEVPGSPDTGNDLPSATPEHQEKTEGNPAATNKLEAMQSPVAATVSSPYGTRHDPFNGELRFHKGVDFAAPEGTKVVPALPGKVIASGYDNGYGNYVLLQHSPDLQTRYAHLGEVYIHDGETVTSENSIGTVGNTGRSTGPHLHFEVIRMGKQVNPLSPDNARLAALR
jgi:murein DD-endopeptidase MepM/ murein hydrolase activator NlpD